MAKNITQLDNDMYDILNAQYNHELRNSLIYMELSSYAELNTYLGFSKFFAVRATEELSHAMSFHSFILQRGKLPSINKEDLDLDDVITPTSILNCLDLAIETEQETTENINNIYEYADQLDDNFTVIMLQPLLTEQIEEEETLNLLKSQIERAKDDEALMFDIDEQLQETNKENLKSLFTFPSN